MKRILLSIFIGISFVVAAKGESLLPGKYMLSAPALYSEILSDEINKSDSEFYCQIAKLENNVYRLKLLNGGGNDFEFKINDSGKIKIVDSDFGNQEYYKAVRGSGRVIGQGLAKGELVNYSGLAFWNRSASEWFLRPATQTEIDKNLKEGLKSVTGLLYNKRMEINKENMIESLGGGGIGYSYNDVPKIEKMIQSGQIEYKDGEFIIHREAAPEEEPIKPDISPVFQKQEISRQEAIDAFKEKDSAASKSQKTAAASPKASKPGQPSTQKPAQPPREPPKVRTSGLNYPLIGLVALGVIVVLGVVVYIRRKRQ